MIYCFELGTHILKLILSIKSEENGKYKNFDTIFNFLSEIGLNYEDTKKVKKRCDELSENISDCCREFISQEIQKIEVDTNASFFSEKRQDFIMSVVDKVLHETALDYNKLKELKFDSSLLSKELITNASKVDEFGKLDITDKELISSLISRISSIIINSYNSFPDFSERTSENIIKQFDTINIKLDLVLSEIRNVDQNIEKLPNKYRIYENEYRKNIIGKYSYIQLYGAENLDERMKKYRLDIAFVQLMVKMSNSFDSIQIGIKDLFLDDRKNIWISGATGAGKTTCLYWLASQIAMRNLGFNDIIPIVIELRNIEFDKLSINDVINNVMRNSSYSIPEGWHENLRENGKFIFLIDGFDEINSSNRKVFFQWLNDCDRTNRCYKVFTSRPQVKDRPKAYDISEVTMLPMDMKTVEAFIKCWHNAMLSEGLLDSQGEVEARSNLLLSTITKSEPLKELSQSPLLCAMISSLFTKNKFIPTSKRELYEACCKMLLENREEEKNVKYHQIKLSYEKKKVIVSKLAVNMMKNDNSIAETSKESVLCLFSNTLDDMDIKDITAEEVLTYLINRTGLLYMVDDCKISFVHRSFQEYLCAFELARQFECEWPYISSKLWDESWLETISLMVGLVNEKNATKLISTTWGNDSKKNKKLASKNNYYYALKYLSEAIEVDSSVRKQINDKLKKWIPPHSMKNVDRLVCAGNMAIPYLKPDYKFTEKERLFNVITLCRIGTNEALLVAIDYLKFDLNNNLLLEIGKRISEVSLEDLIAADIPNIVVSLCDKYFENKYYLNEGIYRCFYICDKDKQLNILKYVGECLYLDCSYKYNNDFYNLLVDEEYSITEFSRGLVQKIRKIDVNLAYRSNIDIDMQLKRFGKVDSIKISKMRHFHTFADFAINNDMSKIKRFELICKYCDDVIDFDRFKFLKKCEKLEISIEQAKEIKFANLGVLSKLKELKLCVLSVDLVDYFDLLSLDSLRHLTFILPRKIIDEMDKIEINEFCTIEYEYSDLYDLHSLE